jgi:hypothetical protein
MLVLCGPIVQNGNEERGGVLSGAFLNAPSSYVSGPVAWGVAVLGWPQSFRPKD